MPQDVQEEKRAPGTQSVDSIIQESEGDLFEAPKDAVLIHACNCLGSWGAGIAKAFKVKYPAAYNIHREHCKVTPTQSLIGKCQLIPPQEGDYSQHEAPARRTSKRQERETAADEQKLVTTGSQRHWIACLFTSVGYGKPTKTHPGMDKPEVILENTRKALMDLKEQLVKLTDEHSNPTQRALGECSSDLPGELWSCKFNSGLFAVEWADTRRILEEELRSLGQIVRLVSPAKS